MRAGRTLQPEQRIAHYRVVGPLGAGGMGEVYLAQDLTLERSIALKVLPPELTRSAERVRRFVQEARSASSLNHPNIVTIHEIGEAPVRMADGDQVTAEPLQYIAMELVHGRTLAARIHQDRTDLRTLLGWLAQAADGIAKAHAAGIVHRDLKPSNIMVSEDGFAKVLDFGLAKLVEPRGGAPGESTAPTQTDHATGEGMLLGTVGYMSPEQVQGKPVDARSDVFSFGCILYEAATRKRPFASESSVETLHRILHDKPAPIEALAPGVPAELRRVIRRCLAKNPEQRLQSMKDLSIELHEIADEFETLSASASSGSGDSAIATAVRRGPGAAMLAAAAVVTVAAIAFGGWAWWRAAHAVREASAATVRAWPQTSDGEVTDCALSRDGRFLAYIRGIAGNSSLHVRQVATGSDVVVVPPSALPLNFVTFSPDGDHVLFCRRRADAPSYRALEEAPSMGGPERERAFDVDSRVSFSPDGKRICFRRFDQRAAVTRIIVRELDSGQERVLAAVHEPTTVSGPPGVVSGRSRRRGARADAADLCRRDRGVRRGERRAPGDLPQAGLVLPRPHLAARGPRAGRRGHGSARVPRQPGVPRQRRGWRIAAADQRHQRLLLAHDRRGRDGARRGARIRDRQRLDGGRRDRRRTEDHVGHHGGSIDMGRDPR